MKKFNVDKIKDAHGMLTYIRETIDPEAFIAGGFAAELELGEEFHTGGNDVDIFFKSAAFPLDSEYVSSYKMLKTIFHKEKIGEVPLETYYYHKKIRHILEIKDGYLKKFDIIQYDHKLTIPELLNTFDLDECKIIVTPYGNQLQSLPTGAFKKAWEKEEIKPHLNMFDDLRVNELQNEKTLERVKKWEKRKQWYFKNK